MKFALVMLSIFTAFNSFASDEDLAVQTLDLEALDPATLSAEQLNQEVIDLGEIQSNEPARPVEKIEPVVASTLKLVGRGIAPRGSSTESLGLACYDEACNTVRFVYFKNPEETYYIGGIIRNPKSDSPRLQKKALSLVISDYMDRHQTRATEGKRNKHFGRTFLLVVGSACLIAFTMPVSGPGTLLTAAVMFPTMGGIYFFSTRTDVMAIMTNGTLVEVQASDQGGWNWSSHPKRIKASNFKQILNQILNGTESSDFTWRLTQEGRFERKQERLRRKGVEF